MLKPAKKINVQVQRASTLLAEASPGIGAATGVLRQALASEFRSTKRGVHLQFYKGSYDP